MSKLINKVDGTVIEDDKKPWKIVVWNYIILCIRDNTPFTVLIDDGARLSIKSPKDWKVELD